MKKRTPGRARSDRDAHLVTPEWREWLRGVLEAEDNDWTASKVARGAGCTPTTINRLLRERVGTCKYVPKITALLTGDGLPPPPETGRDVLIRELRTGDDQYIDALQLVYYAVLLVPEERKQRAIRTILETADMLKALKK